MKNHFTPSVVSLVSANDDESTILSDAELRRAARAYVLDPSVFNGIELEGLAYAKNFDLADIELLVEETRAQIEEIKRRALDASPENHA